VNSPCAFIEQEVKQMGRDLTVSCSQQQGTGDFLIQIAIGMRHSRPIRLTLQEYNEPHWREKIRQAIEKFVSEN
jgi:hypothetical protein